MRFWMTTITRYVIAAFAALFVTLLLSVSVLPWVKDDSPGYAILWFLVFVAEASLIIPASLGITAEHVQRKVFGRGCQWSQAFYRALLALPIAVGPVYTAVWVMPFVESRRPSHWIEKEILLFCVSVVFAYVALRIKQANSATG